MFDEELAFKEAEALKIEDQIIETKNLLTKLRYAVVSEYYKTGSAELHEKVQRNIQENAIIQSGIKELDQKSIHPAVKQLIRKRPANSQLIHGSTSTAAEEEQEIQEPTAIKLTSSRGKNQQKHIIVVGNTSQYIKPEPSSEITHKWMCYLRTKSPTPIECLVKKVRFHLDPSYKPNIIDVTSPPFQLIKRGYGEFSVQLLIFFKDEVKLKPVQIHHQLLLDKRLSGHQVLGNETITEVFTNDFIDPEKSSH